MKKALAIAALVLYVLTISTVVRAASYYFKSGGSDSKDCLSDSNACATLAKANAITLSSGDYILLCSGDTWSGPTGTTFTALGSGTSTSPATISHYDCGHGTALPVIDANHWAARAILVQSKQYWTIDGIDVRNATVANIQGTLARGLHVLNSVSSGTAIGVRGLSGSLYTVESNTIYQGSASALYCDPTVTSTNTFSSNTFIGVTGAASAKGIDLGCATVIYTGNTVTNWQGTGLNRIVSAVSVSALTMSNNSVFDGHEGFDFYLEGCVSPILSSNVSTSSAGQGFYIKNCSNVSATSLSVTGAISTGITGTGLTGSPVFTSPSINGASTGISLASSIATINDGDIRNTTSNGLYSFVTSSVTTNRLNVYNVGADGIRTQGSATVANYYCRVDYSGSDGLSTAETASMTDYYCTSTRNGWTDTVEAGDGTTAHDSSTHNVVYSVLANNRKSGAMMIGTTKGNLLNNTIYNNYDATHVDDYGIAIQSSGTWTIRNNIVMGHRTELYSSPTGTAVNSDYNCVYDSRGGNAFYYNGVASNWADYLTASGQEAHSIHADPRFIDATNNILIPLSNSPCRGTGIDLGSSYSLGIYRTSVWPDQVVTTTQRDGKWDIGSYVYKLPGTRPMSGFGM